MSLNGYSWVEGNVPNWSDARGLFSCSGETEYPAIQSDCDALDNAMMQTDIQIPQIESAVDSSGKIDFERLKNTIQSNFGFVIGGYSGNDLEPLLECTAIANLT
jgi:hypothetical protein